MNYHISGVGTYATATLAAQAAMPWGWAELLPKVQALKLGEMVKASSGMIIIGVKKNALGS
jgi:hypothetical protein